jgi:hypothetical protein
MRTLVGESAENVVVSRAGEPALTLIENHLRK